MIFPAVGFNTLLVLCGVSVLGAACGIIGAYILLHKKALVSDAVSHAALPGLAFGFFIAYALGLDGGRFLPLLLAGAALSGALASALIGRIIAFRRLSEDTAISVTLSVFFGLGIVLFSIIQNLEGGNRSGLESFLLGQTSGLVIADVLFISLIGVFGGGLALALHRYFMIASFDPDFFRLNSSLKAAPRILSALMLLIVCAGLKTTGAILILALLIIPPAAARLLSDKGRIMVSLSALIGAASAIGGAALSSILQNVPTGATIVVCAFALFLAALLYHGLREKRPCRSREEKAQIA